MFTVLMLLIFTFAVCRADIVSLKDGTKVDCLVVSQTSDQIGVKTENKLYFIKKLDIDKIEFVQKLKEKEAGPDWALISFSIAGTSLCVLLYMLARTGNNY